MVGKGLFLTKYTVCMLLETKIGPTSHPAVLPPIAGKCIAFFGYSCLPCNYFVTIPNQATLVDCASCCVFPFPLINFFPLRTRRAGAPSLLSSLLPLGPIFASPQSGTPPSCLELHLRAMTTPCRSGGRFLLVMAILSSLTHPDHVGLAPFGSFPIPQPIQNQQGELLTVPEQGS